MSILRSVLAIFLGVSYYGMLGRLTGRAESVELALFWLLVVFPACLWAGWKVAQWSIPAPDSPAP